MLHVGVGRRNAQNVGSGSGASLIKALNPTDWYRFGIGLTDAGGGVCSSWASQGSGAHTLAQAVAGTQPAIQGDGSLLFDGADDDLATVSYTRAQPLTVYFLGKSVTVTAGDTLFDGVTSRCRCRQIASNVVRIDAGTDTASMNNSNFIDNTYAVISSVFNSTASVLQINNTAPVSTDIGTNGILGGWTLGCRGDIAAFANIQVKEIIIYGSAHGADTRRQVISYLAQVGNISV